MKTTRPINLYREIDVQKVSRYWSSTTWEKYLQSLEGPMREVLFLEAAEIESFSAQECYPQNYVINQEGVKICPYREI